MKKIKLMTVLGFLGLYLFSTGISWAMFTYLSDEPKVAFSNLGELASARSKINLDLPREEECPINGKKFTKIEREIWEDRRPITAIIENHEEARPLSGLSKADVVYEAVAEGGITRFLGVFYCGVSAEDVQISPLRSARIYFVNWAAGYGDRPILAHVGGANAICGDCPGGTKPVSQVAREVRAVEELVDMGWRIPQGNDFDTTYDIGFPTFWRNPERLGHEVAMEHTMMSSTDKIYEEANDRGFNYKKDGVAWDKNFTQWQFSDDAPTSNPDATEISFGFWDNAPLYDVKWKYDQATNSYKRENGGKAFVDHEFEDAQIVAKNVVIMFVVERGPVDSEKHMYYEAIDEGEALIFQNGTVIEGNWEKANQEDRIKFTDSGGKEIKFVRGEIWIEAVPKGNDIDY